MICRSMVPNCPNSTTTRRPISPPFRRTISRSNFRPPAAAGEARATGDLPATAERKSFYELLGIPVSGSHDDIKRAYKQLARKYHPDVSPPDRTEEYTHRFILVHEAYETLSDPECRARYDRKQFDEELEDKSGWKNRWQDQLTELRKRSTAKNNSDCNLSWGARMRKRRAESSAY